MVWRLNGWQRLWVLAGVLYTLMVVLFYVGSDGRQRAFLGSWALFWAVPLLGLYAFGWSVGWVIRGFRQQKIRYAPRLPPPLLSVATPAAVPADDPVAPMQRHPSSEVQAEEVRSAPPVPAPAIGPPDQLKHVGKIAGWLVLPGLGLVIALVTGTADALSSTGNVIADFSFDSLFEAAIVDVWLVFVIVVAGFFSYKHRWTPYLYIAFLVGNLVLASLYLVTYLVANEANSADAPREMGRALVGACIWIPYFLMSKRVKITFVR